MASVTERLHQRGYRVTSQRMAILNILDENRGHLSASQVHQLAQAHQPGITETTVYRALDFLTREGMALATHTTNGHLVYECATRDHIHIICQRCGRDIELDTQMLDSAILNIELYTGFQLDFRHLTIQGICPDCR